MEEAREFAALDMFKGKQITSSQMPLLEQNVPSYSSDFSDNFEKSKNKLIYAAVFSITVGLYQISQGSSFLGLKLDGLSDRRLEWMAWTAAAFFFLNTLLRYFDERRTAERYKNEVAQLELELGKILQRLRDTSHEIDFHLSESGRFEEELKRVEIKTKRLGNTLDKFVGGDLAKRIYGELQISIDKITKDLEIIVRQNNNTLFLIREFPGRIDKFEKKVKPVKKYSNIGGFRFMLFDLVLPAFLFLFASGIHFIPEIKELVLSFVPVVIEPKK